jgi:hypothetical protein
MNSNIVLLSFRAMRKLCGFIACDPRLNAAALPRGERYMRLVTSITVCSIRMLTPA